MAQIRQLEPHVADLIAAGEVVERPASVVKELVENALDAGSTAIAAEIRRGGMELIRITDNGCGMAAEEVTTAFLRHATSKLRGPEDLGKIGTLGFRGEALAAISAVSRVDLLTRQKGAESGAALHLEGGVPGTVEAAGAPEGTTISVRELFYNTPARLKFMKKDSAEAAAVNGLMQHLSLSHPDVSFRLIKDGTEVLHTPGDGKLESAVYAAMGRQFARSLLPVRGRGGDVEVTGFVTRPLECRGSRSMQVFFVNGRFIKSQLLTAALEEGYRNQLMKGRFPGCVVSVTLPVTAVDVNVHPAKTQIKFAREKEVFDAVYHTVLDCLAEQAGSVKEAPPPLPENSRQDFFQSMDAKTFRTQGRSGGYSQTVLPVRHAGGSRAFSGAFPPVKDPDRPSAAKTFPPAIPDKSFGRPLGAGFLEEAEPYVGGPAESGKQTAGQASYQKEPEAVRYTGVPQSDGAPAEQDTGPAFHEELTIPERQSAERCADVPAYHGELTAPAGQYAEIPENHGEQETLETEEPPWRYVGEILRTYLICEDDLGDVWLIDKHAAHERIHFDRLKAAREPPMRQTLLTPAVAELEREEGALLLENLPLLEEFGFACEDFGDGALLVREVPADIRAEDTIPALEEFAEALRTRRSPEEHREALLHTMACKAAVKGGSQSSPEELRALVGKVQSGEVRFCPHGRPVAVKLTKRELEKMFKRV